MLIKKLQKPELYDHSVEKFKVIETHISWVILTGTYAYKIKKPVDFGFLDYTTLDKRRKYSEDEVQLNNRLASDIYLQVVPIFGSAENPSFQPIGKLIEYAIKMRQFPQNDMFTALAERGELTEKLISEVADEIARFHQKALICPMDEPYGTTELVMKPVQQNFDQMYPLIKEKSDKYKLEKLEAWAQQQSSKLKLIFEQRKNGNFIRECHGDLHLDNIVLFNNKPVIFDCIEFNEEFRWLDVMADFGFLVMDLEHKHRLDFAFALLNRYLMRTYDYHGLKILRFYMAYRAIVRAKVTLMSLTYDNLSQETYTTRYEYYQSCLELADHYRQPIKPWILITHGVSCSGKSSLSRFLANECQAIHINSDVERKRSHHFPAEAKTKSGFYQDIYSHEATERTYQGLLDTATLIIDAGYPVIVDATFLKQAQRNEFKELAKKLQIPFVILRTKAPAGKLREWLLQRQRDDKEHSEAAMEVLNYQLKTAEWLNEDELNYTVTFNTAEEAAFKDVDWLIPKLYQYIEL